MTVLKPGNPQNVGRRRSYRQGWTCGFGGSMHTPLAGFLTWEGGGGRGEGGGGHLQLTSGSP